MHLICFEDAGVEQLAPATTSRPAFAVTCGGYRLIDWLREIQPRTGGQLRVAVRPFLKQVCELDHHVDWIDASNCGELMGDDVLVINGRVAATMDCKRAIESYLDHATANIHRDSKTGELIIARFSTSQWETIVESAGKLGSMVKAMEAFASETPSPAATDRSRQIESSVATLDLYRWPHDIVRFHMTAIGDALQHRISSGRYREILDGVFVADDVHIGEHCVFDTTEGPVVLDDRVNIGPMSFFAGPVYAAPRVRVIEHSAIKDAVAIGHTCKVGGEIEASILEPYTNKQHHGFLGHSYLGSWINLGAGTCNSDLKNTYGKINVTYGDEKIATDMQFFGCVVGDYSKTAINTSIFTGKVIGVCSMMYGFVTSNVPSYVNYARLFGQTSLLPTEVMISTQKRMFARRKVKQRPCDKQLIRDMYTLTAGERAADADLL